MLKQHQEDGHAERIDLERLIAASENDNLSSLSKVCKQNMTNGKEKECLDADFKDDEKIVNPNNPI